LGAQKPQNCPFLTSETPRFDPKRPRIASRRPCGDLERPRSLWSIFDGCWAGAREWHGICMPGGGERQFKVPGSKFQVTNGRQPAFGGLRQAVTLNFELETWNCRRAGNGEPSQCGVRALPRAVRRSDISARGYPSGAPSGAAKKSCQPPEDRCGRFSWRLLWVSCRAKSRHLAVNPLSFVSLDGKQRTARSLRSSRLRRDSVGMTISFATAACALPLFAATSPKAWGPENACKILKTRESKNQDAHAAAGRSLRPSSPSADSGRACRRVTDAQNERTTGCERRTRTGGMKERSPQQSVFPGELPAAP